MLWYLFYQSKTYNRKLKGKIKRAHLPCAHGQGLGLAHSVLYLLPRGSKQHGGGDDARRDATSTPRSPWASSRPLFMPRRTPVPPRAHTFPLGRPLPLARRLGRHSRSHRRRRVCALTANGHQTPRNLV